MSRTTNMTRTDELLLQAIDKIGVDYQSEDDEVGRHACCREISYNNHRKDCIVVAAVRHLEDKGVRVPSHLYLHLPGEKS